MALPMKESSEQSSPMLKVNAKKRKISEAEVTVDEKATSPKKRVTKAEYTEIQFKVGLRDSSTRFTALDRFVEEAANFPGSTDFDIVESYCRSSPECNEVLTLLEGEKRKPKELCSIFEVLETILVSVTGRLPKYKYVSLAVVKRILSNHLGTIFYLLQTQNKMPHIKAAVKLLSAMVMQGESAPRDVLKQVDFQSQVFPGLLSRRDIKDPMDVRTCTLHFMLSFLIVGDKDVLIQILETKGFLNSIFPGLFEDKLSTLEMVLPTIREKVVQNTDVSKTLKVRVLNLTTLTSLAKLYRWTGPRRYKVGERKGNDTTVVEQEEGIANKEDQEVVVDMVHHLLLELCCDFKLGINFFDKSYGTSGKSLNHVLTGFLKSLHQPFSSTKLSELVIGILKACPDQLIWYLPDLKSALNPRPSSMWVSAVHLLHKMYTAQPLVAPCLALHDRVHINKLVTMATATIVPPKETWSQILVAVRHKAPVVQHEGLSFLLLMLKRIKATLDFSKQENPLYTASELDTFRSSFKDAMIKVFPDLATLLNCWSRAVKSISGGGNINQSTAEEDKIGDDEVDVDDAVAKGFLEISSADHLLTVMKTLCEYQATFPEVFTENFVNFSSLLEGVRTLASDDDTSSHQVSLVQLHLLRLLAESNLRQITWLKESFSGRSTLYLLLEMITFAHGNPKMVPIAITLLQKLLVSTGVFQHTEDEVAVWLKQLAMSAIGENQDSVLTFVEKMFSAVLKDPYSFTEKVSEAVAEAASIDTGSAGEMGSATTTSDHIIDTILSLDEVDLDDADEIKHETQSDGENDNASRFPFSVLVPAALKLWKEETEDSDSSQNPGVREYLREAVHTVLHVQTDPAPLSLMLQQSDALWIDAACARWLGPASPKKSQSKTKKTEQPQTNTSSLSELLTVTFNGGNDVKLSETCQSQLQEACHQIPLNESEAVVKKILLYMRTHALCALKDDRNVETVAFYLDLVAEILHTVVKANDGDNSETGDSADPTDQLSSLLIPKQTNKQVLHTLVTIIARHPDLEQWFLWQKTMGTKGKAAKLGLRLRKVITLKTACIFGYVPQDVVLSLEPVLNKYRIKAVDQFSTYVEDLLSGDISCDDDRGDVMDAVSALMSVLQWHDVIQAASALAKLPAKLLVKKQILTPQGMLLLTILSNITRIMKSNASYVRDITNNLSLDTVSRLCTLANKTAITDLNIVLFDLVSLCPLYAAATNEAHFRQCIESAPEDAAHKMATVALTHSEACRSWFRSYWFGLSKSERVDIKWHHLDVILQYVRCQLSDGNPGEKEICQIRETYWPDLFTWIQNREDDSAHKLSLLTILTSTINDIELLESSWNEFLAFVIGARRLAAGQVDYLLCLCEAVERAGSSLPVWHVCVGSCLTTVVNLLTAKGGVFHNKPAIGELLNLLDRVLKKSSGDVKPLADVTQPVWTQLVKSGLRHMYKDEQMLRMLAHLVGIAYGSESADTIMPANVLYQMIMSHSQFLTVMLQKTPTPAKDALVELLLTVARQDPQTCCQSAAHVTALLGAYNASLSETDQKLLLLMSLYESSGCSLEEHKPFLWGAKGVDHVSVKKSLGKSLWNRATSLQVMEALDTDRLARSSLLFPLQRKLRPEGVVSPGSMSWCDEVYDPCFLLPLLSHMLSPGYIVDCFEFVKTGCLSYVLSALSCHDNALRGAAYHALAEVYRHMEESRFPAKDQVLYLLQVVRNSIEQPNTKMAPIVTTFLARAARLMVNPDARLYSAVNEFLLLKPAMDVLNVPEFYKLFNSSSLEFKSDRAWMLSLLVDGLRETADYRIFEKRYVFKIILTYYDSSLSDAHTQTQVLCVLQRAASQWTVASDLIKNHGILTWINAAVSTCEHNEEKQRLLVSIVDTLWQTMLDGRMTRMKEKTSDGKPHNLPLAFTNEMLHIVLHLVHTVQDNDDVGMFRKLVVCLCSVLSHLKTTTTTMHCNLPPLCVGVKVTDALQLLLLWNSLTLEEKSKWEVKALLESFGQVQNNTCDLKPKAKAPMKTRRKVIPDHTVLQPARQMDDEIQRTCVRNILQVITHWVPRTGGDSTSSSPETSTMLRDEIKTEASAIVHIAVWCLNQVYSFFDKDLQMICDILQWLRSWVMHPSSLDLRTLMKSDTDSARNIIGQLLTVYSLCTHALTNTSSESEGHEHKVQMADLQLLNRIKVFTTEMLATVVDHALLERDSRGSRLEQALDKTAFKEARHLLSKVKGNHNALCLFIQELCMDAARPSHFNTIVKDTIQNEV